MIKGMVSEISKSYPLGNTLYRWGISFLLVLIGVLIGAFLVSQITSWIDEVNELDRLYRKGNFSGPMDVNLHFTEAKKNANTGLEVSAIYLTCLALPAARADWREPGR
jgi:hypothetical protein